MLTCYTMPFFAPQAGSANDAFLRPTGRLSKMKVPDWWPRMPFNNELITFAYRTCCVDLNDLGF